VFYGAPNVYQARRADEAAQNVERRANSADRVRLLRRGDAMIVSPFPDRNFMQFCWLVPDLDEAMATWTRTAGIGPFFRFDQVAYDKPQYRGKPGGNASIAAAIAQAGDVQIELVRVNDRQPSIWREGPAGGESGLHHAAVYCRDYDATLDAYERGGSELIFTGLMMGFRVGWIDTLHTLGFFTELIDANPMADGVFAKFRDSAKNWDGKDPVRRLS
jgi:Glyoxalase/Bleomycin resistance protein/Dioxygenase superfamily